MDSTSIILSSGALSLLITIGTIVFWGGSYKQKIDSCKEKIDRHDKRMEELGDRLSKAEGGLERDRAHISDYIKSQSPLTLTDKGKAVLLDSGGKEYVDHNLSALLDQLGIRNPKTSYDVQELSRLVIQENSDTDEFIPIKDFVYKKGMSLDILINIIGIYLRDLALEKLNMNSHHNL